MNLWRVKCDLFLLESWIQKLENGMHKGNQCMASITSNNMKCSFTLICGICVVWLEVVKSCFTSEKGWMLKKVCLCDTWSIRSCNSQTLATIFWNTKSILKHNFLACKSFYLLWNIDIHTYNVIYKYSI
jgi:hypothetical protein